jgi:polyribonucleotide nucleotidyltransferase
MPYVKKMYIEITTLDKIDDVRIFDILKKNIKESFIRIYSVNKITRSDIK